MTGTAGCLLGLGIIDLDCSSLSIGGSLLKLCLSVWWHSSTVQLPGSQCSMSAFLILCSKAQGFVVCSSQHGWGFHNPVTQAFLHVVGCTAEHPGSVGVCHLCHRLPGKCAPDASQNLPSHPAWHAQSPVLPESSSLGPVAAGGLPLLP